MACEGAAMAGVTPEKAMGAVVASMSGPFEWWDRDCCTSACAGFASLWGMNPMADYPEYKDLRGAAEFLAQFGGRDNCADVITAQVGLTPSKPFSGALCAAWVTPRRWALGLCIERGSVAFKAGSGFTLMAANDGKFWGPPCPQ